MKKADPNQKYFLLDKTQEDVYWAMKNRGFDYTRGGIKLCPVFDVSIDARRLSKAIQETLEAHDVYSATIVEHDGKPMLARPDSKKTFKCEIKEIRDEELEGCKQQFYARVREETGPLYRFQILVTPTKKYLLMWVCHGILDGTTLVLFFKEMAARYDGNRVEAESFDVFDASAYKEAFLRSEAGKNRLEEFKALLDGYPPVSVEKITENVIVYDCILADAEEINAVLPFANRMGISMSRYLLAVYSLALMRLFGKDRIAYSMDYHGRFLPELRSTHGSLASRLPVLAKLPASGRIADYLKEFNSQLKSIVHDFSIIERSLLEECTSYVDYHMGFNILPTLEPIRIGDTTTVLSHAEIVFPVSLTAILIIEPENYRLRLLSCLLNEPQLKVFVEDIRHIMLEIPHKEMIAEL